MPLEYCFLGLLNIIVLFFFDLKKNYIKILFLALVAFQLGYFIPPVETSSFTLNISNFIGVIISLIALGSNIKGRYSIKPTFLAVLISLVYFVVCLIDYNYLLFFNPLFFTLTLCVVSLFFHNLHHKLYFSALAVLLTETSSIFVIGDTITFYPMFTPDIMSCIVPVIYFVIVTDLLINLILRRKRIEKTI